jgi:hypothetical protein
VGRAGEQNQAGLREILEAQDAADALVVLGWPIQPSDDDSDTWRIGYFVLTDDELIGLVTRRGIQAAAERVQ